MLPTSPANLQHGASAKSEDYENDAQEARRRLSLERPYSQSPTEAKVQAELEAKEAILHQMREQRRLEQEESTVKEAVAPEDDSVSSFFINEFDNGDFDEPPPSSYSSSSSSFFASLAPTIEQPTLPTFASPTMDTEVLLPLEDKYKRMLRIGISESTVKRKMLQDGVTPEHMMATLQFAAVETKPSFDGVGEGLVDNHIDARSDSKNAGFKGGMVAPQAGGQLAAAMESVISNLLSEGDRSALVELSRAVDGTEEAASTKTELSNVEEGGSGGKRQEKTEDDDPLAEMTVDESLAATSPTNMATSDSRRVVQSATTSPPTFGELIFMNKFACPLCSAPYPHFNSSEELFAHYQTEHLQLFNASAEGTFPSEIANPFGGVSAATADLRFAISALISGEGHAASECDRSVEDGSGGMDTNGYHSEAGWKSNASEVSTTSNGDDTNFLMDLFIKIQHELSPASLMTPDHSHEDTGMTEENTHRELSPTQPDAGGGTTPLSWFLMQLGLALEDGE